jgi:hypothetical protein
MANAIRPCEICGEPIDPERLEVLPETRLCIEHARAADKFGGEFKATATRVSIGKSGSLKKNYGDMTVKLKRNPEAMRKLRDAHEATGE